MASSLPSASPRSGDSDGSQDYQQKHHHDMWSSRSRRHVLNHPHVTNDADTLDAMLQDFSERDSAQGKTPTRIVVEKFLSKYRFYNPRRDVPGAPSLSKAYAFYEHVTLPRRFVGEQGAAEHIQRKADPGETEPTELYSPWRTPWTAFIEWGVGVDLYFSTLRIMSILLLAAGLINLPNTIFYSSSDYSPQGQSGVSWSLATSAVCGSWEWVVCSDCAYGPFQASDTEAERDRYRVAEDGTILVARNACNGGQLPQGMVSYGTGIFLVIMMVLISYYLVAREVRADEDKITATDYSIVVRNPPPDAYDPDDWHAFFSQFADKQVTVVTVALKNEVLLRKLLERRMHIQNLRVMVKGIDLEDEDSARAAVAHFIKDLESNPPSKILRLLDCLLFPCLRPFGMFLKPNTIIDAIFRLRNEIDELQKQGFDVSSVYVSFETEEGQRAAMTALSTGRLKIMTKNTANSPPGALFHGTLLRVKEPPEPNSVRWLDLGASSSLKISIRIANLIITCLLIVFVGFCVDRTRSALGPRWSGPLVSIFNILVPILIKILMRFERHTSEGSFQVSLYLKITLFRWVNTAILARFITPFTSTISADPKDLLVQVNSILWAEMWLTPALRLLDLIGNIKKHILAPRALNQESMNQYFHGTLFSMGERYTAMTKILFVVFFYSALFPASFFFGFAILTIQYYTDKFCLMRIWAWSPTIGSELASFSRRYFFSGTMLTFVLVSAYAWAQFPYDNLCDPAEEMRKYGRAGEYTYREENGDLASTTVTQDWEVKFCHQFWLYASVFPFPPTSRLQPPGLTWMYGSQEKLTGIYGWTACVALILFFVIFFGQAIVRFVRSWFQGVYKSEGQIQHIDFSSDPTIDGYVPQVKEGGFQYPFLACNVDDIDESLIGWRDPSRSFDDHNLIFDVPWEGMPRRKKNGDPEDQEGPFPDGAQISSKSQKNVYSTIKYYPPQWKIKLMNNATAAGSPVKSDSSPTE